MNIAAVCGQWRAIAVSTPDLWTRMSLTRPCERISTDDQLSHIQSLLNLWLERSKDKHLYYSIRFTSTSDQPQPELWRSETALRPLVAALTQQSHRWADIELYTPELGPGRSSNVRLDDVDLPHLMRLAWCGCLANDLNISLSSNNAPRLTSVFLPTFVLQLCTLPWSQLTTLFIRDEDADPAYVHEVIDVLSRFTHLKELHIRAWFHDLFLDAVHPTRITLPHLTLLHVASNIEIVLAGILDSLDAPALTALSFHGCSHATWSPGVAAFVERHSAYSKLETVELGYEGPHRDIGMFIKFWRGFGPAPGLKCIGMHLDEGNIAIFHALYQCCLSMCMEKIVDPETGEQGPGPGPALEEVVLSMEMGYTFSHPDILTKTVQYLTIFMDGEGGHPAGSQAELENPEEQKPFYPCARMKGMHFRMIDDDEFSGSKVDTYFGFKRSISALLSDWVERGLELSFELTDKGCMFL